jgi:hypothetical protein
MEGILGLLDTNMADYLGVEAYGEFLAQRRQAASGFKRVSYRQGERVV